MCVKTTGIVGGKQIVVRGCKYELASESGKCLNDKSLLIPQIGKNATNATVCYCTKDKCNGASGLQFTYLSLFALLVHFLYKFASVHWFPFYVKAQKCNQKNLFE